MITDGFGFTSSSVSDAAARAFEEATFAVAGHRPDAGPAIGKTLAGDPDHVGALALKGFANLILAREELAQVANAALADARAAASRRPPSGDEAVMLDALADAVGGSFRTAARRLDDGFADRPSVLLPFKIAQALRFMAGDAAGMLAASARMLAHAAEHPRATGFLYGCHAFALEEHGRYDEAEHFGRRAVWLEPGDAWGLHAVGHVHEMRGQTRAGIAWLEAGRKDWTGCNNFAFHMAWHLALLHLENGQADRALALYDEEVRPTQTDDFRDIANAVSLLWRFERRGLDVDGRWQDLAVVVKRRRTDATLVFAALHTLLALRAIGDEGGAADVLAALAARAEGQGEQGAVARDVGLPMARVIAGVGGQAGRISLGRLALALPAIGGSNAQRDLFMLQLAEIAGHRGDTGALAGIRSVRHRLKREDALIAAIDRRTLHSGIGSPG